MSMFRMTHLLEREVWGIYTIVSDGSKNTPNHMIFWSVSRDFIQNGPLNIPSENEFFECLHIGNV